MGRDVLLMEDRCGESFLYSLNVQGSPIVIGEIDRFKYILIFKFYYTVCY